MHMHTHTQIYIANNSLIFLYRKPSTWSLPFCRHVSFQLVELLVLVFTHYGFYYMLQIVYIFFLLLLHLL
uniref:Uncharacterized protein n=1 Tax=Octopus bimaculoides TaxID=37653 RepID=A0A0L8HH08_OCTBM